MSPNIHQKDLCDIETILMVFETINSSWIESASLAICPYQLHGFVFWIKHANPFIQRNIPIFSLYTYTSRECDHKWKLYKNIMIHEHYKMISISKMHPHFRFHFVRIYQKLFLLIWYGKTKLVDSTNWFCSFNV